MNIYLHHYPASLFSEKIRLILGYLELPWNSVEINNIMPRPLLMPLTGGYRKTPCLQIGANVYCDTQVIARALARHKGDTTLAAHGFSASRVAEWADSALFRVVVALNFRPEALGAMMSQMSAVDLAAFQKDRAELSAGAEIVSFSDSAALAFVLHYLTELDASLSQPFLFGDTPCIADFSIYHCVWFLRNNPVNAPLLDSFHNVNAWYQRLADFGHGNVTTASGEDALAAAKATAPTLPELSAALDPMPGGVRLGQRVVVTPVDYGRIGVAGELVGWDAQEVVLLRDTTATGAVMTHFPSPGFDVTAATD